MKKTVLGLGLAMIALIAIGLFGLKANASSRGETVTLDLTVSTYSNVSSGAIALSYDTSVLEIVTYQMKVGSQFDSFTPGTGKGVMGGMSPFTVSGNILSVTFKIKDNAPFTSTTVTAAVTIRPQGGTQIDDTYTMGTITVTCTHSYGSWTKLDDNNHVHTCSICSGTETQTHTWNPGSIEKQATCKETGLQNYTCPTCGATKTEVIEKTTNHSWSNWTKVDDNTHKRTCTVCNQEETSNHAWNETITKAATCKEAGEKKLTCSVCGVTKTEVIEKTTTHTWSEWTKSSDSEHKRTCSVCNQEETQSHSYSASWKSDASGHYHECSVCHDKKDEATHTPGAEPTETSPQTCTVCGRILKPALGHTHAWATEWTTDESSHWHACSGCMEKGDEAEHDFENACDPDCSICGYTREVEHQFEYKYDETGHWKECTVCGLKEEKEDHVPGPEATEKDPQVCTICDYEIAPATGEETEPESETETEDEPETKAPEKGGETVKPANNNGWVLPVVLGGVLLIGVAGAIVFVMKKKKK